MPTDPYYIGNSLAIPHLHGVVGDRFKTERKQKNMSIIVKVAKLGGIVKEIMLEDRSTVKQALEATGTETENQEVRVNGRPHDGSFGLKDGDIVTLAPKAKGGF